MDAERKLVHMHINMMFNLLEITLINRVTETISLKRSITASNEQIGRV